MPKTHPTKQDCTHGSTVSVIANGLERVICESCGDVTVRYGHFARGDLSRDQFKRKADSVRQRAHAAAD